MSTSCLYPKNSNAIFRDKAQVVGLVVKYDRKEFNTIYDMMGGNGLDYWVFVTEYVRKYGIAVAEIDWNNPDSWGNEDKDIPPTTFHINEVN